MKDQNIILASICWGIWLSYPIVYSMIKGINEVNILISSLNIGLWIGFFLLGVCYLFIINEKGGLKK